MPADTQRIIVRVEGRVQGVGFRYATASQAKKIGIVGFVCNLHDGSVEAVAEGTASQIDRFLDWLRRGPPGSRVLDVQYRYEPSSGRFKGFSIE